MQDANLVHAFEVGRTAWAGVRLTQDAFVKRATMLAITPEDLAVRASDLFLAWGCAERDSMALSQFEKHFLSNVDLYVRRLGISSDLVDEVRQELRIRLLTGTEPRIGNYSGRGPLGAWVRVSAVRLALNLTERARAHKATDLDALGALVCTDASPELAALRSRYADSFQSALERSLAKLEVREKTLLRMHFIDQLNIDAMGQVYRVHRATVARWLVRIRQRVMANLREELSLNLQATSSEFQSIVALMQDELNVSIRRLLGT